MSKARDLADSAQEINILDGKSFLDEDNLASDSATGIASQQSIKAYVDGINTTNITSTGALNSGSITSGFGNIDNGSSTITTTGAISGGSFVIGSADINESDLESIDGITAGTVSASKAVVVNTNKDITGFRNITATGTISGSLSGTLSGSLSSTTTATTQAESDDSTKIATTAYVTDKITTLIGGAPSTLNDLNELAAAINDDANYNTTLTTALATKLPLAGGTMTGDVLYNDSVKAKFGAGSDLQIYHDGSNSYINDTGTGKLRIGGDTSVSITNSDNTVSYAVFNDANAVKLYYNDAKKFETTSTGVSITGGASVSGDITQTDGDLIYSGNINWDISHTVASQNIVIKTTPSGGSPTEAMRIDSSGNVLVGTTDNNVTNNSGNNPGINIGVAGIKGYMSSARYQGPPLSINRLGNDGDIQLFSKDGATVGSIGVNTDRLYLSTATRGIAVDESGGTLLPVNGAGANNDNSLNLGASSVRWKDLHLSGNISVGGTVDGRDVASDGSKLDGVATNANNYSHPTGNGNNHIPSGGSTDQILKYASAGTAQWADASGGSRVLLSRSVMNNTSSYVFTGVDSTKYDSYYIEFNGIVCTQDSKDFLMKFSDNGGSSYKGYGDVRGTLFYHKGGSQLSDTWNEDMRISRQQGFTTSGNFGANVSGYVMIMNAHGGNTVTTQAMGSATYRAYSNEQVVTLYSCGTAEESYSRNIWTDWNAFKLQFDNGNMQKGTISAFGILK